MFLIYLTSRIVSATAAFLYPGYASYKTLSQRPASEAELERWLMYWSVLGCIVAVEYVAEWLVSWIPLYYPMKTLFLLYLSLPQTRGSSYLYQTFLNPFFHAHESDIDAALASLKTRAYAFGQEKLRRLWEFIAASLGQPVSSSSSSAAPSGRAGAPQPTLGDPVSGPAQLLGGLWRSYGPTIIASGAALLSQPRAQAQPQPMSTAAAAASFFDNAAAPRSAPLSTPPAAGGRRESSQSVLDRRRRLEAELAALDGSVMPTQAGASGYMPAPSREDSDADLRARAAQFEQVEVPSDAEGYDVRASGSGSDEGDGEARPVQAQVRRTSWFGWGAAASPAAGSRGAYERVKEE